MKQLAEAFEAADIKIFKIDLTKQRPISTSVGTMAPEKFSKILIERLGMKLLNFPELKPVMDNVKTLMKALTEFAHDKDILTDHESEKEVHIHEDVKHLQLNYNLSAAGRDDKFFCTHSDESISRISGESYLLLCGLSPVDAVDHARRVIPDYMPRGELGVSEMRIDGKKEKIFNVYTPPLWMKYKKPVPDRLPPLFEKLVRHLFPIQIEREYFYAWLHDSLFRRSFVFLILCSVPGTGKNRLKLVLRALHGHLNTIDGKKSTLVEKFNSQLSESTLAWFDELHYDSEMENTMKELQNDSISIERKGVDATRSTRIHASIVVSNNKPRDNFIAFDARKFVPLVVSAKRLEASMTSDEIDQLTQKVEDQSSKTFDPAFLSQIAQWVKRRGASKQWPNLEYRGPMFWTLAHTSMARWQKKAVTLLLEQNMSSAHRNGYDTKKEMFLWSVLQEKTQRKNGDKSLQFPDFTSVKAFFEIFRDGRGRKAFVTEQVTGENIMGDFWVKPLFKKMEIITEASVAEQRARANENSKKEIYDL